ncbi:DUF6344 domain-containing protein [Streptomyces rhizosphaerihabitans]|uniref:DUF6344 domain-containing protein n=1 Tax=Streptomyces rhizosphaerihabitans TaxID=1266770 RepID=UPI0021C18949|nr:DUF6344 domain-containing protein [Streptomyces rhizosphaerihabitans]MCT9005305.1 DUF6344 domain-containing protein [Streptomyces rhizosphaerihabitans]
MTQNKVMKLWTAIVTAFLALCTTLGLITTTAAAAVPQAGSARNTETSVTATAIAPAMATSAWSYSRALPPTMKQRIRAEAHGSSPSCRHRAPADDGTADPAAPGPLEDLADPATCSGPETLATPGTEPLGALTPAVPFQRREDAPGRLGAPHEES